MEFKEDTRPLKIELQKLVDAGHLNQAQSDLLIKKIDYQPIVYEAIFNLPEDQKIRRLQELGLPTGWNCIVS